MFFILKEIKSLIESTFSEVPENNSAVLWKTNSYSYNTYTNHSRTIFFHAASGKNYLNFRESCSIESAAKHNPDRSVTLLMVTNGNLDYNSPWVTVINKYSNVKVSLIENSQLEDYFRDSPIKEWLFVAEWAFSRFKAEHLAQYMALVTLYRNGGLFLDLDFITTKSLNENKIWNAFFFQDDTNTMLSSSMFHLQHGHPLIDSIIRIFIDSYDPDSFIGRSYIIPNFLIDLCAGTFVARKLSFYQCNNSTMLSHDYFYPVPYWSWQHLFKNVTEEGLRSLLGYNNYGVSTWYTLSQKQALHIGSTEIYAVLAAQHCPITVSKYREFSPYFF